VTTATASIDAARLAEALVRWLEKPGNYIDIDKVDARSYRDGSERPEDWAVWMQEIIDEYEALTDD
jgi:hypothetical protein